MSGDRSLHSAKKEPNNNWGEACLPSPTEIHTRTRTVDGFLHCLGDSIAGEAVLATGVPAQCWTISSADLK